MNLCIVHTSALHEAGVIDCMSEMGLSFAFQEMCFESILKRFKLYMKDDILADVLNLPVMISLTASCTGLESGIIIRGYLLSFIISCFFSIPVANASASSSHGYQF